MSSNTCSDVAVLLTAVAVPVSRAASIRPPDTPVCSSLCVLGRGRYHCFPPREKGDRHCQGKAKSDDMAEPKRCLSFQHSRAPGEELRYPTLSPGSAQRLPATGNQQLQPGISGPFAILLSIPLHRRGALRIQHPLPPAQASRCSTHPSASLLAKRSTSVLMFLKKGDGNQRQPLNAPLRPGVLSFSYPCSSGTFQTGQHRLGAAGW